MYHRKNAHNKRAHSESEHVVFGPYRHKEKRKTRLKEKAGTKPKSDDSISTVLEEDEELGGSSGLNKDGLQSLLDNVEDLLDDAEDAAVQRERASTVRSNGKDIDTVTRRSVQKQLEELNAPRELQQATALLLQSTLLDEDTARLLTNDILDRPAENDNTEVKEGGHGTEDCIRSDEESAQSREDGSTAENHVITVENDTTTAEGEEELQPSESTSLLSVSNENDDMLRPSIFTMHSGSLNSMSPPER